MENGGKLALMTNLHPEVAALCHVSWIPGPNPFCTLSPFKLRKCRGFFVAGVVVLLVGVSKMLRGVTLIVDLLTSQTVSTRDVRKIAGRQGRS